jgi:hypothetical protein
VWHPSEDRLYFSMRPPKRESGPWVMEDRGEGIYWIEGDGPADQIPKPLLTLANQEFDGLTFSPVAPFEEICFLHYPWHHGDSARSLYRARITPDGTLVEGEIEEILIDDLSDMWCAFAPDGEGVYLHQSFTSDKFDGTGRHSIARLRIAEDGSVEESLLRVGAMVQRPTFSRSGHLAGEGSDHAEGEILIFDLDYELVGGIRGEDLGLPGWRLTSPVFE